MMALEISSFTVIAFISGVTLVKITKDTIKNLPSIVLNIILGGAAFIFLNIIGYEIPLNFITGAIIMLLGIPGIILIVMLKVLFGIF